MIRSVLGRIAVLPVRTYVLPIRPITDRVAWFVGRSVCWSVTVVSPTKTDQPIEIPFGLRIRVGLRNHVLDMRFRQLLKHRRRVKATFTRNSRYFYNNFYLSVCDAREP